MNLEFPGLYLAFCATDWLFALPTVYGPPHPLHHTSDNDDTVCEVRQWDIEKDRGRRGMNIFLYNFEFLNLQ